MLKTKQFKFDGVEYKIEPLSLEHACACTQYTDKEKDVPYEVMKEAVLSSCFYREDEGSPFIPLTEAKLIFACIGMPHLLKSVLFNEALKISLTDDKKKLEEFFALMRDLNPNDKKK